MVNDPDMVAMIAASAALTLSGAPFRGPIAAARVGFEDGDYVLNPTVDDMDQLKNKVGSGVVLLATESDGNDLILGAVGPLQFDVVAARLRDEYNVECQFETVNVATARWVECDDAKMLADFEKKAHDNLALDHGNSLVYIAPTKVNLSLTEERWPDIGFRKTREH